MTAPGYTYEVNAVV